MLLACLGGILFSLSAIAVSSPKMSGAIVSRTQADSYDAAEMAGNEASPPGDRTNEEGIDEDAVKVARRSVRKFSEESQVLLTDREREQEQMPITRLSCDCPEVLTKGTLAAIVAALAFLGFFSTSVLLVVSIWVLRLMSKQKKPESRDSKRPLPPIPPPRPEHTYSHRRRSANPYEALHPVRSNPPEGVYLSASEINPGPGIPQDITYESPSQMSPGAKSSPENEYIAPGPQRTPPEALYNIPRSSAANPPEALYNIPRSSAANAPEALYASIQRSSGVKIASASGSPAFHAGSPTFHASPPGYSSGSPGYHGGSPGYHGGSPGFHGGSPNLPSGSPVGSPGSPVGLPKGRKRGIDEHIYEEVN